MLYGMNASIIITPLFAEVSKYYSGNCLNNGFNLTCGEKISGEQ